MNNKLFFNMYKLKGSFGFGSTNDDEDCHSNDEMTMRILMEGFSNDDDNES